MNADAINRGLKDFHCRWPTLQPPLRPNAEVARNVAALLPDDPRPVLLLGVTPEFAALAPRTIGMDWNPVMARMAWPGGPLVVADWRTLPLADRSVGAVIGDGSLSMLHFPDAIPSLLTRLARATGPGGRLILRCFATPDQPERIDDVRDAAFSGAVGFHEFKLRFNMAVAAADGGFNVTSARLFDMFDRVFPDRAGLARASGWRLETIAEIDAYRGSDYIHSYPGRAPLSALASAVGRVRFEASGDYPGAASCPLLIVDFA